ncbi:hypothetical protein LUZ60_001375 [Juncus effusus]|nr:hypothetical protein LUZ60_001375 [Juncus effusus]
MMPLKLVIIVIVNLLLLLLLLCPSFTSSAPSSTILRKVGGFGGTLRNSKNVKELVNIFKELLEEVTKDWAGGKLNELINGQPSQSSKPVPQSSGVYEIYFSIGNQTISAGIDTSSGIIWTQCNPCATCFEQSTPLYDPKKSSTFSNFTSLRCNSTSFSNSSVCQTIKPDLCPDGCEYLASYSDDQNSTGYVATDTFTFGTSLVPDILFGCGTDNYGSYDNTSGVLALGKGPLSFVSQLGYMRFSYCLSSDPTKESPINFGSFAMLKGMGQSTKLVASDNLTDLYYIGLVDVTVGNTRLSIPSSTFTLKANGSGGVVLSTSFPVTYLEQAGYDMVRQAIVSQVNLKTVNGSYLGLDLCFQSLKTWPTLTLHFDSTKSLALKSVNYVLNDTSTGIECLTILPSSGISVLGSFIQMDTNFVYDIENSTISFEKCSCSSSLPHRVTTMVIFLSMLTLF